MPDRLPDSHQALADYLDDMLHQATLDSAATKVAEKPPPVLLPNDMLAREIETPATESIQAQPVQAEESETPAAITTTGPDTIDFPLQCLMFRIGDHLLSVPLIQLSGVINWNGSATRLPESPDWMLGLIKHRDSNLRIVDGRQLLNLRSDLSVNPEHLLVLGEGDWAITCDQLEQVVNIEFADVQWKAEGTGGLTLGTIRQSLSTLLNPSAIKRELDTRVAPAAD